MVLVLVNNSNNSYPQNHKKKERKFRIIRMQKSDQDQSIETAPVSTRDEVRWLICYMINTVSSASQVQYWLILIDSLARWHFNVSYHCECLAEAYVIVSVRFESGIGTPAGWTSPSLFTGSLHLFHLFLIAAGEPGWMLTGEFARQDKTLRKSRAMAWDTNGCV